MAEVDDHTRAAVGQLNRIAGFPAERPRPAAN